MVYERNRFSFQTPEHVGCDLGSIWGLHSIYAVHLIRHAEFHATYIEGLYDIYQQVILNIYSRNMRFALFELSWARDPITYFPAEARTGIRAENQGIIKLRVQVAKTLWQLYKDRRLEEVRLDGLGAAESFNWCFFPKEYEHVARVCWEQNRPGSFRKRYERRSKVVLKSGDEAHEKALLL